MADNVQNAEPKSDIEKGNGEATTTLPQRTIHEADIVVSDNSFKAIRDLNATRVVVLSFRALQLKRIGELQDELLKLQLALAAGTGDSSEINPLIDDKLNRYARALRNYETLSENTLEDVPPGVILLGQLAKASTNSSASTTFSNSGTPQLKLFTMQQQQLPSKPTFWTRELHRLQDSLFRTLATFRSVSTSLAFDALAYTLAAMDPDLSSNMTPDAANNPARIKLYLESLAGTLGYRELDSSGRAERERRQAYFSRLGMALFGGVALIGPMLIMVLVPGGLKVSLWTVSVATFIFALSLAVGARDSLGKDVLASVAAYAAVLVVFVGTSFAAS